MPKQIATGAQHEGTGLKNSLHGTVYQLVVLMWLIDRCVNDDDIEGFLLSTEDDRGEKFDDAVLTITNKEGNKTHHFIQAKHKQDDNATINESALLTSSKSNNDFQLSKYYDSFKKISKRLSCEKGKLGSVTLIVMLAIFLEKKTKKTKDNSNNPSSQTEKDEPSLSTNGSKGKGKQEHEHIAANTRTVETTLLIPVDYCDQCGESLKKHTLSMCGTTNKNRYYF